MNNKDKFNKLTEYSDKKYSVFNFKNSKSNFKRLAANSESICILPFFKNEHNQIRSVVLANTTNHINDANVLTCISHTYDPNRYDSYYSCVLAAFNTDLSLDDADTNDIFYLGKVTHTIPFLKEYRCFSIDLSKYFDDPSELKELSNSTKINSLENIKFSKIVNGSSKITDSLCLSCSLLLMSYFSSTIYSDSVFDKK
jgi:hypothetical protein